MEIYVAVLDIVRSLMQAKHLLKILRNYLVEIRQQRNQHRPPWIIIVRVLIPAFFLGLIYFHLHHSVEFFSNVDSVMMNTVSGVISASAVIIVSAMPINIHVCIKETGCRIYGVLAYYLAVVLHDLPTFIAMPFLFGTITFWMPDISSSWLHYLTFVAVLILVSNTANALGQMVSSFSSTIESAVSTVVPTTHILMIFSGFFLSPAHIHPVLRIVQYLSPYYYAYSTLFTLQWRINRRIGMKKNDRSFLHSSRQLYPNVTSSTIDCCARSTDDEENLAVLYGHIYSNVVMLFLLCAIWHIIAFASIWYRAHRNRLREYWLQICAQKNKSTHNNS
jgi:hypothetical protein